MGDVILAEVTRRWRGTGPTGVESVHRGSVVIADCAGKVLAVAGEDGELFLRSSAKPFQALAPALSGALDHFGFGSRELALFCSSHNGERMHVELGRSILDRLRLDDSDLDCGVHPPIEPAALASLYRSGGHPGPLHNNCSGKHLGMLTLARFRGWPIAGYVEREHPVQQEIFRILGALLGRDPASIPFATDGCGVPTARVSQREQAQLFALLASPEALPADSRQAVRRIAQAMAAHPELVAGTGRMNTHLLQAAGGALVAKTGAEGSVGVGLRGRGLGISIKLADGNSRALGPVLAALLGGLGLLSDEKGAEFRARYLPVPVTNARGERVGEVRPAMRPINALLRKLRQAGASQ